MCFLLSRLVTIFVRTVNLTAVELSLGTAVFRCVSFSLRAFVITSDAIVECTGENLGGGSQIKSKKTKWQDLRLTRVNSELRVRKKRNYFLLFSFFLFGFCLSFFSFLSCFLLPFLFLRLFSLSFLFFSIITYRHNNAES